MSYSVTAEPCIHFKNTGKQWERVDSRLSGSQIYSRLGHRKGLVEKNSDMVVAYCGNREPMLGWGATSDRAAERQPSPPILVVESLYYKPLFNKCNRSKTTSRRWMISVFGEFSKLCSLSFLLKKIKYNCAIVIVSASKLTPMCVFLLKLC